jgi:hypothetical protein
MAEGDAGNARPSKTDEPAHRQIITSTKESNHTNYLITQSRILAQARAICADLHRRVNSRNSQERRETVHKGRHMSDSFRAMTMDLVQRYSDAQAALEAADIAYQGAMTVWVKAECAWTDRTERRHWRESPTQAAAFVGQCDLIDEALASWSPAKGDGESNGILGHAEDEDIKICDDGAGDTHEDMEGRDSYAKEHELNGGLS